MIRAIKLKVFGRSKIRETRIEANSDETAEPEKFYLSDHYSEKIVCQDCGVIFIHTAEEKHKYFEVQKGNIYKRFVRCNPCDALKYPHRHEKDT